MKKICFFITLTTLLNYYYVVPGFLQKSRTVISHIEWHDAKTKVVFYKCKYRTFGNIED